MNILKQKNIKKLIDKNNDLISYLDRNRNEFLSIGTNKTKRRLNKLSENDKIAKAIRLALEIEDKNIQAKKYYGKYKDKIYDQKYIFIKQLIDLFKTTDWIYGKQKSDVRDTNYIIYFEIPFTEQISWHVSLFENNNIKEIPNYTKEWDKKINSTLKKLEEVIKNKYSKIIY